MMFSRLLMIFDRNAAVTSHGLLRKNEEMSLRAVSMMKIVCGLS